MQCIPESWHVDYARLCRLICYLCPVDTCELCLIRYHFIDRIEQHTTSMGQHHMPKNVLAIHIHRSVVLHLIIENLLRAPGPRALEEVCHLSASSMASWYHLACCKVATHSSKLVQTLVDKQHLPQCIISVGSAPRFLDSCDMARFC